MKTVLVVLMLLVFTKTAQASTEFTKEDDYTLKTTTTEQVVTESIISLPDLMSQEANKLADIKVSYDHYVERDTALRAELLSIRKNIIEAGKLGIKETAEIAIVE